ncbi:MAG: DUF2634 domain-containing protein [Lachnospiraceae bacterium]|nr:DUF2634 domain-containing protein [Lachnospiraceae bacterium]
MIPSASAILATDFETTTQSTHTYAMNLTSNRIRGYTDGQDAMKQAIYKILNTERYQYIMYSWNYGIELRGLFGQPISYVVPELERRITEALTWDDRINSVSDFVFDTSRRGVVAVSFTVNTIYGDVSSETEVNI